MSQYLWLWSGPLKNDVTAAPLTKFFSTRPFPGNGSLWIVLLAHSCVRRSQKRPDISHSKMPLEALEQNQANEAGAALKRRGTTGCTLCVCVCVFAHQLPVSSFFLNQKLWANSNNVLSNSEPITTNKLVFWTAIHKGGHFATEMYDEIWRQMMKQRSLCAPWTSSWEVVEATGASSTQFVCAPRLTRLIHPLVFMIQCGITGWRKQSPGHAKYAPFSSEWPCMQSCETSFYFAGRSESPGRKTPESCSLERISLLATCDVTGLTISLNLSQHLWEKRAVCASLLK